MAAIDIGVKFSLEKLDQIVGSFNKLIEGVDFGKGFELDAQTIKAQFSILKDQLSAALASGELDVKALNLPGLVRSLESVAKQAASAMGSEINDKALEPLKKELDTISSEIDQKANKLKDITSQRKELTEESVKRQTKEETGGAVSRVMFGSMAEAETYLKKLKEAEKEDPGASQKRAELISFYEKYVANLKKAEKAKADLNNEEQKIKDDIVRLKAKEEALLLKIKQESAALDGQAPANIKEILALTAQLREVHEKLRKTQKAGNDEKRREIEGTKESTEANHGESKSLAVKAISAGIYYTAINAVKNMMRQTVSIVKEMDKAMTDAAIVTDMNRKEAWALMGTYQQLAKTTGLAVTEISGVVVEFLKQGRTMRDALELAEVAAKAAKVAGISAQDAVNYLTSAVNGFGLAADKAVDIADKFSAIAAASASDFEELAIAMSKVAPVAKTAGVGVDFMMGVLAKGLETTREAPENIGTAFKTIFARMREVTDIGKATEDGMSLNRVEKSLQSIGVTLRDGAGQFRNLEDVLMDVGEKWDKLNSIEQAYIATTLAGTRQQPRLLAIFNDFARTKELIETSSQSVGALQFQHIDYMDGMEAAMNRLQNAWQGFVMALTESDVIIGIIQALSFAVESLAGFFKFLSTPMGYTIVLLGLLGTALTVMFAKFIKTTIAKVVDTGATIANTIAQNRNIKSLHVLNVMKFKNMVASLKSAAATTADTKAKIAGNAANITFMTSLQLVAAAAWAALAPLLPFIAAAALFIGVVALIVVAVYEASKNTEFFAANIDKVNKKLNDLENKEKTIKKLSDRFKELQKVTNKTAEQIEEMNRLAEELNTQELTVNGETRTYDFATVDFTGESVFNEEEYQRFLDDAEQERLRLNEEARKSFESALRKDGEKAFDNKTISDFARKAGYEAGVAFADSLGEGYSDELKDKVKKQLSSALKSMDMAVFYKTGYSYNGKTYNTLAEAQEAAKADGVLRGQRNTGTYGVIDDVTGFDEDSLKEFSEKLTKIYADSGKELQDKIKEINENSALSQKQKAEQILLATADTYAEQIAEAKKQFEGEELTAAIAVIGQSNVDGAILHDLIYKKEIDVELIANLSAQGLDATAIQDYLSKFIYTGPDLASMQGIRSTEEYNAFKAQEAQKESNLKNVQNAIQMATAGGAANITQGFASFRENLAALGYTPEQIKAEVKKLGEIVQTLSVEQVGGMIKAQADMTKAAMNLSADIGKGDFTKFGEVVAEYGIDAATDILNGSEAGIRAVMEKNAEETRGEIAASIAEIYALEGVTDFNKLSKAAQEQVRSLELMRDYYEDIVGFEMLREFRMKQISGYMKEMNDLMKLQQSLLDLGMADDDGFLGTINGMVDSLDRLARAKIDKQLTDDLENLEQFGTFDGKGNFIVNPDINITQANQAVDAAMATLTTYVQMQTEAFNRQKKAIEEAAKAEIDAAKKSFNERWAALEYTNKLAEAEEKIYSARRQLAALSLSGASGGQLGAAQKDLKKLEEERRKMVEQQALDELQKELEAQRDEAIVAEQVRMTEAIQEYTNELTEVLPALTDKLEELIVALDDNTDTTEDNTAHQGVTIGPGKENLDRSPFLTIM